MSIFIYLSSASLGIERDKLKILFKESARPEIYLQVSNGNSHNLIVFNRGLQVRHHNIKLDEDLDPLLSFLPPILADKTQPSVQVFFRQKDALNGGSNTRYKASFDIHPIPSHPKLQEVIFGAGAFLKRSARKLDMGTFPPETMRVGFRN